MRNEPSTWETPEQEASRLADEDWSASLLDPERHVSPLDMPLDHGDLWTDGMDEAGLAFLAELTFTDSMERA